MTDATPMPAPGRDPLHRGAPRTTSAAATTSRTGRSRRPCSSRWSWAGRCCSKARRASARRSSRRCSRRASGRRSSGSSATRASTSTPRSTSGTTRARCSRSGCSRRAARPTTRARTTSSGRDFLIRRPLLQALESTDGVAPVLLIDEIDRADEEFEAYLLEILSDFQVTVPEIGTITAEQPPRVILTSNRTREVHDALKRRCLYHWIDYPTAQKEFEIVLARVPGRARAPRARGGRASSTGCARPT